MCTRGGGGGEEVTEKFSSVKLRPKSMLRGLNQRKKAFRADQLKKADTGYQILTDEIAKRMTIAMKLED